MEKKLNKMGLLEKRQELLQIVGQREMLEKQEEALKKEIQGECQHEALLEADYQGYRFGGGNPPRRMCLICGLEENGWGCGYGSLRRDDKVMKKISGSDRDEFYRHRKLKSLGELEEIITAKVMKNLLSLK